MSSDSFFEKMDHLSYEELDKRDDQGEIIIPPYKGWMIYRYPKSKMHIYTHYSDHPAHDGMPDYDRNPVTCRMCNVEMPADVREHLHNIYEFIYGN